MMQDKLLVRKSYFKIVKLNEGSFIDYKVEEF